MNEGLQFWTPANRHSFLCHCFSIEVTNSLTPLPMGDLQKYATKKPLSEPLINVPVRICHGQDVEVVEVEDVGVEVGVDDQLAHDEGGRGRRDPLSSMNT
jgi:hypothetical protein